MWGGGRKTTQQSRYKNVSLIIDISKETPPYLPPSSDSLTYIKVPTESKVRDNDDAWVIDWSSLVFIRWTLLFCFFCAITRGASWSDLAIR